MIGYQGGFEIEISIWVELLKDVGGHFEIAGQELSPYTDDSPTSHFKDIHALWGKQIN